MRKAAQVWAGYLDAWEAKLAGRDGDAEARFKAARDLAQTMGFAFLTADRVAALSLQEIHQRIAAIPGTDGQPDPEVAVAVLGAIEEPGMMLSDLVARAEEIAAHENRFKSDQQMRLWRNPRSRAVRNLTEALGRDVPVLRIGTAEARMHRRWMKERVNAGEISAQTANKDFSNEAQGVSTAFVDAAWVQVRGLAQVALDVEALTPQCHQLQATAGCIVAVLEHEGAGAVRMAAETANRRVRDIRGSDARSRRTRVLMDEALRLVAVSASDRRRICAHPSIVASAA